MGVKLESRATARTGVFIAALLFIALLLNRPSILGELYTPIGVALAAGAALLAILDDRTIRWSQKATPVIAFLALGQAWLLFRRGENGLPADPRATLLLLTVLVSAAIVLSNRDRALAFGRIFVWAVIVLCASCTVTAALWVVGVTIPLFDFFTGQWTAQVLFPFTPSVGSVYVSGSLLPRFGGIGREPGWMGMYITLAAVAWRWVGRPRWWGYAVMAVGLICTLSTAGFGIFIVVIAYEIFFRGRPGDTRGVRSARLVAGAAMMAAAVWVALYAPVVGLLAKSDVNVLSLNERTSVLTQGLDALLNLSLGAPTGVANDGIGLVASTAPNGWPYFLFVTLAFLVPLLTFRGRAPVAMVLTLYLTILLAQPPQDSISVYVLLLAVFAWASRVGDPESISELDRTRAKSSPVKPAKAAASIS